MPAYPILRFVNSIAASPTVDLDLNLGQPFSTKREGFSLGAPPFEGDPLSVGVLWGYRTLTLTTQVSGTNTVALTAYSALAKQITVDNLLMVQLDSTQPPVFFRTYKTQPTEIDMSEVIADSGQSYYQLSVQLTADPFGFGVQETGNQTINNDPAAGSNPCFYRFGTTVKGDVETPLYLEAATSDVRGQTRLLASQALTGGATQTGPVLVQADALTVATATTGGAPQVGGGSVTLFTGDAAMSGGTYSRYTSGVGDSVPRAMLYGTNLLPGSLVGDYRVLMRGRASAASDSWAFKIVVLSGTSLTYATYAGDPVVCNGPTTGPHWFDMGVFRFPFGAPPVDQTFDTAYTSPGLSFAVVMTARGITANRFEFDCFLFIPVGLDQAAASDFSLTGFDKSGQLTTAKVVWNGLTDSRYLLDGSNQYSPSIAPTNEGGLPTLVPGMDNSIHYLQHVGTGYNDPRTGVTTGTNDVLTNSTVLTWKYYPRYLWLRPAGG